MTSYIDELIKYTEHIIRDKERPRTVALGNDSAYDRPQWPMVVINMSYSLDEDQIYQLKSDLFSIWPRYKEVIPFINGHAENNYFAIVNRLLDVNNRFCSYDQLLLYLYVDTSEFNGKEDFVERLSEINEIRLQLSQFRVSLKCVLFLMFSANDSSSDEIRSVLKDLYVEDHFNLDLVVVLGNQLNNFAIITDDRDRIRELTTIILLSNGGGDQRINPITFDGFRLVTIQSNRLEKAYSDISMIIITKIFNEIQNRVLQETEFDASIFLKKVGVDENSHYFTIFDKSVQESHVLDLLSEEILFFPTEEPIDTPNVDSLTYDRYNEMTMGTLKAYLDEHIRSSEFFDPIKQEHISIEYLEYLYQNLSLCDLKAMSGNVDLLISFYIKDVCLAKTFGKSITDIFASRYKAGISENPEFYSLFFKTIDKLCKDAERYSRTILDLIPDIAAMGSVDNDNLRDYYQQIVDSYIRNNPQEFDRVLRIEVLQQPDYASAFIKEVERLINNIVTAYSDIFKLPYVEELRHRLNDESAKGIIQKEITLNKQNLREFYCSVLDSEDAPRPVFTKPVLLINQNGSLKDIQGLKEYSVINTMSDSFVEKIMLLGLNDSNI